METDFFDMCVFLWCHGHQVRRQPIDRSVPVRVCTHVRTVLYSTVLDPPVSCPSIYLVEESYRDNTTGMIS
jgi:hypothetical protein